MSPPERCQSDYNTERTELAEKLLLEVWSRLGEYHDYLVLIGGLVPRYIITQKDITNPHAGTLDVDLGISIAVANINTYRDIRSTLINEMDFRSGINAAGREQKHSFYKTMGSVDINIDFLTTRYNGPENSLMREIQEQLSAIQVEGLGLAFVDPLKIPIEGELLSGGKTSEVVNVTRPIPFIILKSLAFSKRRNNKDAYDIVYLLQNYKGGPEALAACIREDEKRSPALENAVESLQNHFKTPSHNGPIKYKQFTQKENANNEAFAAVQDFLQIMLK